MRNDLISMEEGPEITFDNFAIFQSFGDFFDFLEFFYKFLFFWLEKRVGATNVCAKIKKKIEELHKATMSEKMLQSSPVSSVKDDS